MEDKIIQLEKFLDQRQKYVEYFKENKKEEIQNDESLSNYEKRERSKGIDIWLMSFKEISNLYERDEKYAKQYEEKLADLNTDIRINRGQHMKRTDEELREAYDKDYIDGIGGVRDEMVRRQAIKEKAALLELGVKGFMFNKFMEEGVPTLQNLPKEVTSQLELPKDASMGVSSLSKSIEGNMNKFLESTKRETGESGVIMSLIKKMAESVAKVVGFEMPLTESQKLEKTVGNGLNQGLKYGLKM